MAESLAVSTRRLYQISFGAVATTLGAGFLTIGGIGGSALVYASIVTASTLVVAALWQSLLRAYLRRHAGTTQLVHRRCTWFWHVDEDGGWKGEVLHWVRNDSAHPVAELPEDREGVPADVALSPPEYRLADPARRIDLIAQPSRYETTQAFLEPGVASPWSYWTWKPKVSPPLRPGESLSYARIQSTARSEAPAFTEGGAPAGIFLLDPVFRADIFLVPPVGFRVELLGAYVTQADGGSNEREYARVGPPKERDNGLVLHWRIDYPRVGLRYQFRYRMRVSACLRQKP